MYNRYIPQPDGSYHRDRIPDSGRSSPPHREPPPPEKPGKPTNAQQEGSVLGFLRGLLPKNFDTGDLFVLLLLLLMAGDSEEDKNTALLTLAFYFFM